MSENNKTVLNEEELDAVAGGFNDMGVNFGTALSGSGDPGDPYISPLCWYTPNGSGKVQNGRMECNTHCKGTNYSERGSGWWQCRCHGSNACQNRWHLECGNSKRYR